jgi:hypothetical protein
VADADATVDVSLHVAAKLLVSPHVASKSLVLLLVDAKSLHLAAIADAASQRAWVCSRNCSARKIADATADASLLADLSRLADAKSLLVAATEFESELRRFGASSFRISLPSNLI